MRILVTGAAGFLGLNLLKGMAAAHPAAEILAVDLDDALPENYAGLHSAPGRLSYRRLNVCDADACCRLMRVAEPAYIVHAAAVTFPDDKALSIQMSFSVNLEGTRNLLRAAASTTSVQRVLLLSSSGLYDHSAATGPCDEEHALDLSSAYTRTKRQAEMHMAEFEVAGGFPVLAARIGPVYGEFEWSRTTRPGVSIIQKLLDRLLEKRPISIAGSDVHRDWTHAADVAKALDLLLFAPKLNHRIYNVSSGVSVSANSILELFIEHGLRVTRLEDAEMADIVLSPEQNRKPLVIERLRRDTGFTPCFNLRTGIAQIIAARKEHSEPPA